MVENKSRGGSVIFFTFVLALMLVIIPLPEWVRAFRPEWVTMMLIYWCLALPSRINVGTAWILGLVIDVLTGNLLGQHALAMSMVAFVTVKLHQQIRVYPMWQQALSVFTLIALGQLLIVWVKGITGDSPHSWTYWAPSLMSALLWPWFYAVMREIRQKFSVN